MLEERAHKFAHFDFATAARRSVHVKIAIISGDGEIVSINPAWQESAEKDGMADKACGLGSNYFEICEEATGDVDAEAMALGVRQVATGASRLFYREYPCDCGNSIRCIAARVARLEDRPELFAISHEDITDLVCAEQDRLSFLRDMEILDSEPETRFDEIVHRARETLKAPTALFTLIDEDRQWFKSRVGLSVSQTDRASSICAHAVSDGVTLVVPDTTKDIRFSDSSLVTGAPYIRSYAGVPVSFDRHRIGALCIIDYERRDFANTDILMLQTMARELEAQVEIRQMKQRIRNISGALSTL